MALIFATEIVTVGAENAELGTGACEGRSTGALPLLDASQAGLSDSVARNASVEGASAMNRRTRQRAKMRRQEIRDAGTPFTVRNGQAWIYFKKINPMPIGNRIEPHPQGP